MTGLQLSKIWARLRRHPSTDTKTAGGSPAVCRNVTVHKVRRSTIETYGRFQCATTRCPQCGTLAQCSRQVDPMTGLPYDRSDPWVMNRHPFGMVTLEHAGDRTGMR